MGPSLRNVVVVGASAAGLAAADGLREAGFDGSVTILSAETIAPYDRPSLSKSLLASVDEPRLRQLRTADHLAAQRFDLRLGVEAAGLDIDRRYVVTTDGEALPYDALIIATGTRSRTMWTVEGRPLPTLRTAADFAVLRQAAASHSDVTLIGSGFIGLELAAAFRSRRVDVTVFGRASVPLVDVLGREIAAALRTLHAERGAIVHCGRQAVEVSGEPGGYTVRTSDGYCHRTSYVIAGIGVDPETAWLARSGVAVEDGVLCDADGRTSAPGVYAAGDVARYADPTGGRRVRIEHWTNAVEQGRHAALNLARGERRPFVRVPYFWTDQYDRKYHCYGHRSPRDHTRVVEGTLDSEFIALYGDGTHLHGVIACGCLTSLAGYRRLLQRRASYAEAIEYTTIAASL
ncbi:NAD(P)/FAD-dependent oxidoreductase [Mycobacterium lentiflavum]|uniref:NAD(P)/FAD-dependent oxidoreductase n=1 Tax=Mycobacterium lentiflavum TaxID=141349 RepID=A0ABY3USL0_MYCLN|nr:FAD/NAD(P)-binding oxidoreductase [Mycobacterium lentiflavum]ULP41589.1 NAD(P)/FAD-dependent oxidoreductase [Mycobacterium lentiflavum]